MRTAVYALAALAAASGASAFMPQASFAGRTPSLRARASVRQSASVGQPLFFALFKHRLRAANPVRTSCVPCFLPPVPRMCGDRLPLRNRGTGRKGPALCHRTFLATYVLAFLIQHVRGVSVWTDGQRFLASVENTAGMGHVCVHFVLVQGCRKTKWQASYLQAPAWLAL